MQLESSGAGLFWEDGDAIPGGILSLWVAETDFRIDSFYPVPRAQAMSRHSHESHGFLVLEIDLENSRIPTKTTTQKKYHILGFLSLKFLSNISTSGLVPIL